MSEQMSDLIQEDDASVMQQHVVLPTSVIGSNGTVEAKRETNVPEFFRIQSSIVVTLNFANRSFFDTKNLLSTFPTKQGVFNLYAPFRKAKKGTDRPNGVVREVLPGLIESIKQFNNSSVMMLGKPSDLLNYLKHGLTGVKNRLNSLSPLDRDYTIMNLEKFSESDPEKTEIVGTVKFSDVMDLTVWTGDSRKPEGIAAIERVNFNLKVTCGNLYDSAERHNVVQQIESVLLHYATEELPIRLVICMDAAYLSDASVREFVDYILSDEVGYALFSKGELVERLREVDWLPPTKTQLERDLFVEGGDIVMVKLVGNVTEEEAE